MKSIFEDKRELFPILKNKTQLSSCSQSALSIPVMDAIAEYTKSWLENGMDWIGWMGVVQDAKAEFAKLINALPEDIAVMSCVSDIASSIGSALEFTPGKNGIVLGEIDFPSMGHVWLAHERKGAEVKFVEKDSMHCIELDEYRKVIDDSTCLVSVSHASYYNGFIQDLAAIAAIAHQHEAIFFVDAYQSVGSLKIDVVRDDIDVLAAGAQKFMLGCPGIAFVYIKKELAGKLKPSNTGWFGRVNPFAFDIHGLDYAIGAPRFDTGTPPMINAYAARAGMRILNSLDMATVQDYLQYLSTVALTEIKKLGLNTAGPLDVKRKGPSTAIYVKDASAVEKKLAYEGFIVSARNDVIRIAPHFYNNEDEVVAAIRALSKYA